MRIPETILVGEYVDEKARQAKHARKRKQNISLQFIKRLFIHFISNLKFVELNRA
jgi:hypothetical protein